LLSSVCALQLTVTYTAVLLCVRLRTILENSKVETESGTHIWLLTNYHRTSVLEKREDMESRGKVWWGSHKNTTRPDQCSGPDGRPSRFIDPRSWER
jgi:hypothetical protein